MLRHALVALGVVLLAACTSDDMSGPTTSEEADMVQGQAVRGSDVASIEEQPLAEGHVIATPASAAAAVWQALGFGADGPRTPAMLSATVDAAVLPAEAVVADIGADGAFTLPLEDEDLLLCLSGPRTGEGGYPVLGCAVLADPAGDSVRLVYGRGVRLESGG